MEKWVIDIMTSLGYGGIALLMFLENLFPPIPSELIMPFAGFTVHGGKMQFLPAILAGTIGTIVGALPWYYLGKVFSEDHIKGWVDKYGKWISVSSKDVEKANKWFHRHGVKAVFFCRLVPGVRTLISLPAGMNEMPLTPFLIYSTIGTVIWVSLLTGLGYFLGDNYKLVDQYLSPVSKIVAVTLVIWFVLWIIRKQMKKNQV